MPTTVYRTNAPIVCPSFDLLNQCSQQKGIEWTSLTLPKVRIEEEGDLSMTLFIQQLRKASSSGQWVACDALEAGFELLREAVHEVWLRTPWNHHSNFRFWVIDGALRKLTVESNRREQEMLPFILSKSAMFLTYTEQFHLEFEARELVSSVEESYLAGVGENNQHLIHLQDHDLVMLFRRAKKEEIFIAVFKGGKSTDATLKRVVNARSMEGLSVLDIAIEKDFRQAAVFLRDNGNKSEEFNFDLLLDPNFQPMLNLLLDPWKQFPFDPKESTAALAVAGRASILKKLFVCRVDVDFEGQDYPLAEACSTEDMNLIHIVMDRMSSTGVHPCQDYRLGVYFVNKILTTDYLLRGKKLIERRKSTVKDPKHAERSSSTATYLEHTKIPLTSEEMIDVPIPEVTLGILLKLCRAITEEETRVAFSVHGIQRAAKYSPELVQAMLQSVDVKKADYPEDLLRFFIQFDPENECASEITKIAMEKVGQSGESDVDDKCFDFIAQMLRVGPRAVPMTKTALELTVARDYVPLTYRRKGGPSADCSMLSPTGSPASAAAGSGAAAVRAATTGGTVFGGTKTLLMYAVDYPPNYPGLVAILQATKPSNREQIVNQTDESNSNVLHRLITELCQDFKRRQDQLDIYGDCIRALLNADCDPKVSPPQFSVPLFTFTARQDLGEVCYELLPTRPLKETSILLSCSTNLHALMINRFLKRKAMDPPAPVAVVTTAPYEGQDDHVEETRNDQEGDDLTAAGPVVARATPEGMVTAHGVDSRINPPPVFLAGQTIRTVISELSLVQLGLIVQFVPFYDRPSLMESCVTWYFAALSDLVWIQPKIASGQEVEAGDSTKQITGGLRLALNAKEKMKERGEELKKEEREEAKNTAAVAEKEQEEEPAAKETEEESSQEAATTVAAAAEEEVEHHQDFGSIKRTGPYVVIPDLEPTFIRSAWECCKVKHLQDQLKPTK